MEFNTNEAIYLQIAGYVGEQIVRQQWPPDQKIPSVRDLAAELQVNPNTVMRTYEFMQDQGALYNKRGIGFFVAAEATERVQAYRRERFLTQELPVFFNTISLLGIGFEELSRRYAQFQATAAASSLSSHEK